MELPALAPLAAVVFLLSTQDPRLVEETIDGLRIRREVLERADGSLVPHGDYSARSLENDKAVVVGQFENGLRHGRWRHRFPSGEELAVSGAYRDGLRSGTWEFRYPSGRRLAKGKCKDGWPDGPWEFWLDEQGSDGEPVADRRSTGVYRRMRLDYESGERRGEGMTLDGALHGPWVICWPDGSTMLQAEFDRGSRAGEWRFHHWGGAFDPEFATTSFAPGAERLDGFYAPPLLPGDAAPERPAALDMARVPEDLLAVAPLPPAPGESEEAAVEVAGAIEVALSKAGEPEGAAALERILASRRLGTRIVLEELRRTDWSAPDGLARAQALVEEVLARLLGGDAWWELHARGGAAYGWDWSTDEGAGDANRIAFLRAYGFYVLSYENDVVWTLDLTHPTGDQGETLLHPRIDAARLLGSAPEGETRRPTSLRGAGGSGTEQPLREALEWLKNHQSPDGSWDADGFMDGDPGCSCDGVGQETRNLGVTGLALLALMGGGSDLEDGPYRESILAGVRWILQQQEVETGRLLYMDVRELQGGGQSLKYSTNFIYDHAIATRVLCEALRTSDSFALRVGAQKAINYIVLARNPYGVWRYDVPPIGEQDTSVTGWAVGALHAARNVGLMVDEEAFTRASHWLDEVTDNSTGRVGYDKPGTTCARVPGVNDHFPPERGEALTAVGLLSRFLVGQDPDRTPIMEKHADLMLKTLPEWDPDRFGCDMYYWYYGTYAMFQIGGHHWNKWNGRMKPTAVNSQRVDGHLKGSWDPVGPWGFAGGRVYSTAIMALCLEVYFERRVPNAR